jgi:hypothetical protein
MCFKQKIIHLIIDKNFEDLKKFFIQTFFLTSHFFCLCLSKNVLNNEIKSKIQK